tara:strand:- start:3294 stop:3641 length:348 start_codon:yes stop_codon:yes gene_type:complete
MKEQLRKSPLIGELLIELQSEYRNDVEARMSRLLEERDEKIRELTVQRDASKAQVEEQADQDRTPPHWLVSTIREVVRAEMHNPTSTTAGGGLNPGMEEYNPTAGHGRPLSQWVR